MIHLTRQLSCIDPWSSRDVPGTSVGIVDDDAWSAEAHKWVFCSRYTVTTVTAKQCAPMHFYLDLQYIGLIREKITYLAPINNKKIAYRSFGRIQLPSSVQSETGGKMLLFIVFQRIQQKEEELRDRPIGN